MELFLSVMLFFFILISILLAIRLHYRPYDGTVVITTDENGKRIFSLELDRDPDEIEEMDNILFKVMSSHDKHPL